MSGLVITASQEMEGRIVDYHADLTGYDIMNQRSNRMPHSQTNIDKIRAELAGERNATSE